MSYIYFTIAEYSKTEALVNGTCSIHKGPLTVGRVASLGF